MIRAPWSFALTKGKAWCNVFTQKMPTNAKMDMFILDSLGGVAANRTSTGYNWFAQRMQGKYTVTVKSKLRVFIHVKPFFG
jgi:hypothetical protein